MEETYQFHDFYENTVLLSFTDHPFARFPKHVWVICRYKNQWLLTKHKRRGYEFPGGKVEKNETTIDAAKREVMEETGGVVDSLTYLGQYKVDGKGAVIIKNIYFATIKKLTKQRTYYETNGPILLTELPTNIEDDSRFSFMMKDEVLKQSLRQIKKRQLV
ncbi:RNA deprotection pyrophosphohydrolase [Massilibacterium senegalense]|uniref:RNA deprotection pyrophosphohydrolase n=1 Tax=Massilibacterium senegalense TaxID=1632858 RepID=UPI000785651B|nr:nucleoside triphosphatase YtkD [Massilibacterium senegalense]